MPNEACRGNAKASRALAILASGGFAVAPHIVLALGSNDTLLLEATAGVAYNSNVLGISNQLPQAQVNQLLGGRSESDWIVDYGAGLRLDLPVSRQRFQVDLAAIRYDYHQFTELNYTGYTARGTWDWRVGNDWFGQLRAGVVQSQQTYFSGLVVNVPAVVRNYEELVDAHYALTPRWEVYGSLSASQSVYKQEVFQQGNLNVWDESIGATYRSPLGNSTGAKLTFEQGEWPNQPPLGVAQLSNTYTQYTLAMTLDWRLSGKSQLAGELGFTSRTQEAANGNNTSSGPSGRVTYTYAASGKTELQASLYQIFGPLQDPTVSYAKTTGIDLGATYLATAKITLQAKVTYQKIDYLATPLAGVNASRNDKYWILGLSAKYQATRTFSISAGVGYENITSNVPLSAFDVYTAYLNANLAF